jgi:hypothetical protein
VPLRACTVSFTGPTGIRRSVDVQAETLFEAAGLGLSLLRQAEWIDPIAPGTPLEVKVKAPETTHSVTLGQLQRWCEGAGVPDEIIRKQRVKELLAVKR